MKKLALLLVTGSVALAGTAQERMVNIMHSPMQMDSRVDAKAHLREMRELRRMAPANAAYKTTAAPRWYIYTDYFDLNETAMSSSIAYGFPYLWGDTTVLHSFNDGSGGTMFDTAGLVSYGMVTDPSYSGFNNFDYYPGLMKITATDAYSIDSIQFSGTYLTNPAKTGSAGFVDTLRVSIVHGTGGSSSSTDIFSQSVPITAGTVLENYGTAGSNLTVYRMFMDATLSAAGSTVITRDILLDNTTTPPSWAGDTTSTGLYIGSVGLSSPIPVPAGSMVGVAVSFISGEPHPAYDTVFFGGTHDPLVKYNLFRPAVAHRGTSGSPAWPTYNVSDRNTGEFAGTNAATNYSPLWFWSSGSSAASVQYPEIAIHAICASCGVVEDPSVGVANVVKHITANAYPNPAVGELNVPFTSAGNGDVIVSLTNTLGQVVATQNMGAVTSGKAVFNTTSIPAGVYSYTVLAGGEKVTGRVSVVH